MAGLPVKYEDAFYIDGTTIKKSPAAGAMNYVGTITANNVTVTGTYTFAAGTAAANGGNAVTLAANGGNSGDALNPDANALAQYGWVSIGANRVVPYWKLVG